MFNMWPACKVTGLLPAHFSSKLTPWLLNALVVASDDGLGICFRWWKQLHAAVVKPKTESQKTRSHRTGAVCSLIREVPFKWLIPHSSLVFIVAGVASESKGTHVFPKQDVKVFYVTVLFRSWMVKQLLSLFLCIWPISEVRARLVGFVPHSRNRLARPKWPWNVSPAFLKQDPAGCVPAGRWHGDKLLFQLETCAHSPAGE